MTKLYDIMERWSKVMETGATPPVDLFPILKLIPQSWFGNWISRAEDVGRRMNVLYGTMRQRVVKRREAYGSKGSFIDTVLDQQAQLGYGDHQVDFIGGVMMEGGSDTTSTMMLVFLQAMANHSEIQHKAQTEIDAVVGEDRTPRWSDFKDLPYVNQIIKECIRWRPVTPLAFPHALAKGLLPLLAVISASLQELTAPSEDTVNGHRISAGTTVILNVWGLQHDPVHFANPEAFDPDRYAGKRALAPEYAVSPDFAARDHYVYGAGRRICPGMHLAERNMFLAMAKMLWAYEIAPRLDAATGSRTPIGTDPECDYTEGFLVCPSSFAVDVKVRSDVKRETILGEFALAERNVFASYE